MVAHSTRSRFTQTLLAVMDGKHHWAWEHFATGRLSTAQLKIHFQQEYAVYVRDFPVFLARIHGKNPPTSVRRMLAENIYEEDTGGLSLGRSHPALFLSMMEGLGFRSKDFEDIRLLPAARRYRTWLDRISNHRQWVLGASALTIFVEGSVKDRAELTKPSKPKTSEEIEAVIAQHPLVKHHGLSPNHMDLIRAHQAVEAGHRHDAYDMVVNHATTRAEQQAVLTCLKKCLILWLAYRDAVAKACGITKP
ncbi:MAG TPA: iron-containing redox enzyme family protein [Nitrospira sp.]|nr:iron-containing redox enzyme family protein [Nitrospira sp.]